MVFAALFTLGLLAASATAMPSRSERMAARIARRGLAAGRGSTPLNKVGSSDRVSSGNSTAHVEYSSNWSGAVYDSYGSGTFKAVTASFVIPTPKVPSGGSSSKTYYASAWVGIDGDTCGNAILQTGLDFEVRGTSVSYDSWYEWYPDYAYDFSGISFSAGDTVTITVTAATTKSGTAVIKNVSKGTSVSKSITSSSALCEENAEWIVEDFESGSSLVPLANWGTVTFTGALATFVNGSTIGPSGATLIDLKQGSTVYSSVSTTSTSVTVTYV